MKKTYILLSALLFLGIATTPAHAQLGDVGKILQSTKADANTLVENYLKPFGSGFGSGLNTGWTNTAKPHKTLGFDITVTAALSAVPDADKTFNVNQIGLEELELKNAGSDPTAQTINGSDKAGPTLGLYKNIDGIPGEEEVFSFELPSGTDFNYVPTPQIKAGVGVIKHTDLMLRFVPKVEIGDYGAFQQFGIGAKHGINHFLPGGKHLPVDLSVMVGYTSQTVSADLSLTADDIVNNQNKVENTHSPSEWDGQEIKVKSNALNFDALVGKTLPILSVYAGVGFETSSLSITSPGTYPTVEKNPKYTGPGSGEKPLKVGTAENPISVDLDGNNKFHGLAGFRIKLSVVHISGSYKLADYSTFNLGVGVSIR